MGTGTANFTLRLGKNEYKCDIKLPVGPVRVVELLPVMNAVAELVVDNAVEEAVDEGRTITCKAGCGACCRQPVPISIHEAEALLRLIGGMEWERRVKVEGRFVEAMRRMQECGLIEGMRGIGKLAEESERRELAMRYFELGIACPFLEEESCSIYEQRPMRCREYLVTSPAEHCAAPTPETVKMVVLKGAPAQALYRLGEGEKEVEPEFIVMTLLPEWKGIAREATIRAPQILQNFLISLGGGESKSESKPE